MKRKSPTRPIATPAEPFRQRFPWLGGDLQTLRDFFVRPDEPVPGVDSRDLRFPMPDGSDDVLIGHLDTPARPVSGRPLAVLIHGLTGCADSFYLRRSARAFPEAGFATVRLNLRGAGPSRPLCRQQYHSGRSEDLAAVLDQVAAPDGVVLIGWSLGGNMMLKGLSEFARERRVRGAVSVSAPIDLARTARRFTDWRNWPYHRWLLARMKHEAAAGPDAPAPDLLAGIRTVIDFDDVLTGPLNGFRDAAHYYDRCSANRFLGALEVPTLLIHALDDPWIPAEIYRAVDWARLDRVSELLVPRGGHVGFHGPGGVWSDAEAVRFLSEV